MGTTVCDWLEDLLVSTLWNNGVVGTSFVSMFSSCLDFSGYSFGLGIRARKGSSVLAPGGRPLGRTLADGSTAGITQRGQRR